MPAPMQILLLAGALLLLGANGAATPSAAPGPALRGAGARAAPAGATTSWPVTENSTTTAATTMPTSTDTATTTTLTTTTSTATTVTTTTTIPPLFFNSKLYESSAAPLHSFYMYRAVSDKTYPPDNVNTGNLAGVLWYLHNEVVHKSPRKFDISRIVRYKVQTRATQPLYDKGMNFGVRFAFDSGQCTGPFECVRNGSNFELCAGASSGKYSGGSYSSKAAAFEFGEYGYFVGCNNLGHFPFPTEPIQYPAAVWYSLPGPCSSRTWPEHDEQCVLDQPGGRCSGTPTGQGNCTWNYEEAGNISLDELVGIPNYEEFLRSGRREYDKGPDRGHGFTWWDSIHDKLANKWRLRKARELFARKYPHMEADLEDPPCDFNFKKFYSDPGFNFWQCSTAKRGEKCYADVKWAMKYGIRVRPSWYPGLTKSSTFKEFQDVMFKQKRGHCTRPACKQ
mmetsp:Transcript_10043/g.28342  ORF Transcript_10043/g.28342 Transcript_10043/m.28342 type:complete len:451 (+) Transcript_10043:39-1391(+)